MKQKLYTCAAVEQLLDEYIERGAEIITIEEGVLGYGLTICFGNNLKTAIIREVALNEWESAHSIRLYNKTPEKYKKMIEKYYESCEKEEQEIEEQENAETLAEILGKKLIKV